MSIHIDSSSVLHHDQEAGFALVCPHCQILSHMTAVSVPRFEVLNAHRPGHAGIVYGCDSCNMPVFLRFPVKMYAGNRIELSPSFLELERPREKFAFTYLPEDCELTFREALACHAHDSFNAFASMCRRTAQSAFRDLGENGRLRIFDLLAEIREMAGLDAETFGLLKRVLFDTDADGSMPPVGAEQAGVLLEVMKDLLYQAYVRRGKLQQAMKVRRYFAGEGQPSGITPLARATP